MTSVFIDGAAGTTGLEIRERLAGRTDLSLIVLDEKRRKDPAARAEASNDADIAILCLPDDAAREAVALIRSGTRVIDASSAHRTAPGWTYGFPELEHDAGDRIAEAARVSNPGCYPTGFLALVRPLVRAGLIAHDRALSVHAVSGYSGGGKAMIAEFARADAPAWRGYAYGSAHKHVAEMAAHAGLLHPPLFAPAVARTYRGMVVEVSLSAMPPWPDVSMIEGVLVDAYRASPLVQVAPPVETIAIVEHAGTDAMTLRVCANAATGQARLVATLDNLGKGAAGAAVQNLNLMAGLDPLAGLIVNRTE